VYIAGMSNVNCVFVVEEDAGARSGLSRLLRIAGYDVHDFAHASEFLDAIGTEECGCLVLDLGVPELSGKELKEEITARGVSLSIIVVTADDDVETRNEAVKMGAVGFFRKPVDGTALLDIIDWAIRSSSTVSNHEKT
jgi:FixJ family two-component response regulator